MTGMLCLSLICIVMPLGNASLTSAQSRRKPAQTAARYACPMHPEVTSSKPGKCPKCGMRLRLITDAANETPATSTASPKDPPDSFAFSSSRIPDVKVLDQNGKALNFYSDLIKDRTVAVNFIFTTCTTICPPLTATFRRVQQELNRLGSRSEHPLEPVLIDPSQQIPPSRAKMPFGKATDRNNSSQKYTLFGGVPEYIPASNWMLRARFSSSDPSCGGGAR